MDFHKDLKKICDKHNKNYYKKYKKWCDKYFFRIIEMKQGV